MSLTMKLRCALDDDQRQERSARLVDLLDEKQRTEEEKKEAARAYKSKLDDLRVEETHLRTELRSGYYLDEVEVREERRGKRMITIRCDTDEVVADRALVNPEVVADADEGGNEPEEDEAPEPPAQPAAATRGRTGRRVKKASKKRASKKAPTRQGGPTRRTRSSGGDAWDVVGERAQDAYDGEGASDE